MRGSIALGARTRLQLGPSGSLDFQLHTGGGGGGGDDDGEGEGGGDFDGGLRGSDDRCGAGGGPEKARVWFLRAANEGELQKWLRAVDPTLKYMMMR